MMGTFAVVADWYNPRNPKCRCCVDYEESLDFPCPVGWADCKNSDFKGNKRRYHNDKACVRFRLDMERWRKNNEGI